MKKQLIILIGVLVLVAAFVGLGQLVLRKQVNISSPELSIREVALPESSAKGVTPTAAEKKEVIIIDFGDGSKISGEVSAQTAFGALEQIAKSKGWSVEMKKYKYGLIVEKIGEKANSKEYFWSYLVNDKTGQIAADRQIIHSGDEVEWVYKKM